jgi:hypothetical protein
MRSPPFAELRRCQAGVLDDLLGFRGRSPEERAVEFVRPPAGGVEDRWAIYANGFLARLVEALENDFPSLRRVLGAGSFGSLTARYVAAHPPRSYDLGRAGARLAPFLQQDPLTGRLPFLPDLATLEWAVAEAFVAADAEALRWGELAGRGPAEVASLPLRTVPGPAVVRSEWPLLDIWRLRDMPDDAVDLDVTGRPSTVLVYRRDLEVRWRPIDDAEAQLLEAASRGASLERCEGASVDQGVGLVAAFQRLVADGVFVAPPAHELIRSRS